MEPIESKVEEIEKKIDNLTEQITKGFELMTEKFLEIEGKVESLKGGAKGSLGTVESTIANGFADVITELKKINAVTRYKEQHDDLEKFGTRGNA